jgi:adenylate cyclase class 1
MRLWHQRLPWHDEQPADAAATVPPVDPVPARHLAADGRGPPPSLDTLYYRLLPSGAGRARRVEPRPAPQTAANKPFYDVQAIVGKAVPGKVQVTLYCNQREFSELEHGDQLFSVVAREIIEQRRETERYRCYITDLDLTGLLGDGQSSSNMYLRYKADLEHALNEALEQA